MPRADKTPMPAATLFPLPEGEGVREGSPLSFQDHPSTAPTRMNTTVTENKFNELKNKLRELFELDKSDLDFGIYRIMAAKNKEVTEFLDRQLKDVVRDKLAEHGAGAASQVQIELDKAIEQAHQLGVDPDAVPKVTELKAKLAAAGGAAAGELEADIYNHLLAFFSRYYDEGDFISKRRYKGDTYAIPYAGEEVTLYWANKDQYYIKSGEWHKDYRFKTNGGRGVHFKVVQATQETNNNKEPDDAKRRYILAAENPVEATDAELTLRFEFRVPTEPEKQAVKESEATRIFGGKYDANSGRTQGDEREQFCADAEKRALVALSSLSPREKGADSATARDRVGVRAPLGGADWAALVSTPSPTETKPARTLLGKHLDTFTARNTFDYFIHKDLGGFLRRELDFYIKNEVVRLDDLATLPADHLLRVQGKVNAIRAVAGRVIDFLAAIENFQKKMWLKKKFVLETNWLVTVDRIPDKLRDIVAANEKQWKEWEALGFKPEEQAMLTGGGRASWGTRQYLDSSDKLILSTRFFDRAFLVDLLASDSTWAGASSLEDAITGLLVQSENSQALRLLQPRYAHTIQCTYIDPPYNTVHSKIAYKNQFEHASWLSLLQNGLDVAPSLWTDDFSFGLAIDDYEYTYLSMLLRSEFPTLEQATVVVNHHPQGSGGRLSRTHEYYLLVSANGSPNYLGRPIPDETEDRSFMRSGTAENNYRHGRPNSFYALLYDRQRRRLVGTEAPPEPDDASYPTEPTREGYQRIYPINSRGEERVWRAAYETGTERVRNNELFVSDQGVVKQRIDHEAKREVLVSNWTGPEFNAGTHGTSVLDDFGLGGQFDYPKSVKTMETSIWAQSYGRTNGYVLDYFAGSGTTGHAVINLNREEDGGGRRKFILIEMGAYFTSVLLPRITKVLYCPSWKSGKPQAHGSGVSALVKCFTLESYEDALNNLPAPTGEMLEGIDAAAADALITYSLDLELGPCLLNLDIFRDPWSYSISAQPAGDTEIRRHSVDLLETFNYLLGLRVSEYGRIERYSAELKRSGHDDGLGRLTVVGRLRRDAEGPYVFQRVEGELNDANATRVLVIWRKLTDNPEKDAAVLDAWMERHREDTRQRSEHRDYHRTYVNGPVTLPQPTAEIRTVFSIEEAFKDLMFADTEGESHA